MQTIHIDLERKTVLPLVHMKQRDVGAKILLITRKNGVAFPIPADASFSVWFSGASGEGNYSDIDGRSAFDVQENNIAVEFIYQMLNCPGEHMMCLVMNDSGGNQTGFWNIPYYVEKIPGADSESAKQYYQAFLDAQAAAERAAAAAAEAAERAGSAQVGNAVLYTEQNLTATQKAQARQNIGAAAVGEGVGSGGGSITVDDALNPNSTNPVQNKVITSLVGEINQILAGLTPDAELSPTSTNPVQNKVIYAQLEQAMVALQNILNAIPTDAHINALIDAKLGVIENGAY